MANTSCQSKSATYYGNRKLPQEIPSMSRAALVRDPATPTPPSDPAQTPVPPKSKRRPVLIAAVAALAVAGTVYFIRTRGMERTDNAQIDADVVLVPARVAGTVSKIHFVENQPVKAGALLAELDDAAALARLAQAEAVLSVASAQAEAADADAQIAATNAFSGRSVAAAGLQSASVGAASTTDQIHEGEAQLHSLESSLAQAGADRTRARHLFESGAIPKIQVEQAETAYQVTLSNHEAAQARLAALRQSVNQARSHVAEASARLRQSSNVEALVRQSRARAQAAHAQVETARAARELAALDLSYTKILAPHDGVVSKKSINEGQSVSPGQPIVQLVTPNLWVTANFKETQVGHMRVGQPAHFTVDAYPGVELTGQLESLSGATGSRFTLLPPDNATGNYTKVVQRMPVRVSVHDVPAGVSLRPGMSVELTINTRL
jgi:membrane fusion protein (multidrug efflux system)